MLQLCDHDCNQRTFPWPPPNTQYSLLNTHSPYPQPLATTDVFSLYLYLFDNVTKKDWKESYSIWFYLLSIMHVRFIHGFMWISDLFVAILSNSPWMSVPRFSLLIHLPVERHLNCVPLLVFINKVTIDLHMQLTCDCKSSFLSGKYLGWDYWIMG